ncbi:MAG: 50S ribosomal protein L4 [Candidatus Margulisiibacteriota bacterium]
MKLNIVDIAGKKVLDFDFGFEIAAEGSSHQLYLYNKFQKNKLRAGTASTKTKSEVSGGGSKPYRQKGTGNARRGSNRTPLRPGGGISFGPKPRSFATKLNKSVIENVLKSLVSTQGANMVVLDTQNQIVKTKQAQALLGKESKKAVLLVTPACDFEIKSFSNLPSVSINSVDAMDIVNVLQADKVVLTKRAAERLQERLKNE